MKNEPEIVKCALCGEPMPPGETMFKFHGYSGPCPKPPLPRASTQSIADALEVVMSCENLDEEQRTIIGIARARLLELAGRSAP